MANIETSDYEVINDQYLHTYLSVGTDDDRTDPPSETVEGQDQNIDNYLTGRLTPDIGVVDPTKDAPSDTGTSRFPEKITYENVDKDQKRDTYLAPIVGTNTAREAPSDRDTPGVPHRTAAGGAEGMYQNRDIYPTPITDTNSAVETPNDRAETMPDRKTPSDRATPRVSLRTVDEVAHDTDQGRDTVLTPVTKEVPNDAATSTFPWRAVCVVLFSGILICIVISTVTGVVVYHLGISSRPPQSQDQQTPTGTNHTDLISQVDTLTNVVQSMQERRNYSAEQVAFLAHTPTGTLVDNCPTFSTILINIGGGYNTTSGQFRAPVAGLYSFSVTLWAATTRTGDKEVGCNIYKNSAYVGVASTHRGPGDSASVYVFIHLSVGDIVNLSCYNWKNYIRTSSHTSFTGALIRVD